MTSTEFYNKDYFDGGKGYHTYDDANHFTYTAETLIRLFEPKSVLDVGCAKGYLVKAFRKLGVPAFGIDISEYAISQAPEEVDQFLFAHDITKPTAVVFPKVDLVVSCDTFEHIPEADLDQAMSFIKAVSERAYIKVGTLQTPNWEHDPSHITMHRLDWWIKRWPDFYWEESR